MRDTRRPLGAALALALAFPAAPLLAGHGGGSRSGGSHSGGSHSGGSHGSGSHHGSRGGGSHHGGGSSGGSRGHGRSHGRSHTGGEWIFLGAPWWGGLGWWYPDGGPYVEAPDEDEHDDGEPEYDSDEELPVDDAPSARAMLTFSVEPDDAVVYIDGHLLGTAEEIGRTLRGVPVAPGEHTIAVERPGLAEWSAEIDVAPGESRNVEASLKR